MSGLVSPIAVEAVGLANVRFFAPPSGEREYPWVSLDDVLGCMTAPRELRRHFESAMRRGPWADSMQMVAIEGGGIANIVPHFVAQGVIDGMQEVGGAPSGLYVEYARAGAKALSKLTDGMSPGELLAYIAAAVKASGGSQ